MKRLLPMLLALALPGCAGHGAEGIPVPVPTDMATIQRPRTPNTALAAPADFHLKPDIVTAAYDVPPDRLYALMKQVAAAQPRTFLHVAYDDRHQVHYVVRSAVFNFPDLVTVQVNPDSTLIIWSRSVYGESDLGVNKKRVAAWLAALDAALHPA
jgi:uncharacterized protein (DUF1499 family)